MKRADIEEQYKWDLSRIYANMEAFESDLAKAYALVQEIGAMKGHLTESVDTLLKYQSLEDELIPIFDDLYNFPRQWLDVEPNNQVALTAFAKASNFYQHLMEELVFVNIELIDHKEEVEQLVKDPRLAPIAFNFEQILRDAPYILDEKMEHLFSQISNFGGNFHQAYAAIRPTYKPVLVDGKEEFLNDATLTLFLRNPNREVRKQAYENFYAEYKPLANTYTELLLGHYKWTSFHAKHHRFGSALAASLFNDNVSQELFNKVLFMANEKYHATLHEYYQLKKEIVGVDPFFNYDINVPSVEDVDPKFTIEEGIEMICEALAPLGEEYLAILRQGIKDRWVDFKTHEEKRSGAYSGGTYRSQPYILMNWVGNLDSVYTLAHELGHSMHSYLSNRNNPRCLAQYKIFVAEVASIVNEVFLTNYLLKKYQDDKKITLYIYNHLIEEIIGTIYRQPMFAEFEKIIYEKSEANEPLSTNSLSQIYRDLSEKYYGPAVTLCKEVDYSCFTIPHFYYNFYVYKYTIGMSCALTIVSRILNGDTDQTAKYLSFLKSGGSDYPVELLKKAKVDPREDLVYDEAFTYFAKVLAEFRALLRKK